jgi:hypothetical protein
VNSCCHFLTDAIDMLLLLFLTWQSSHAVELLQSPDGCTVASAAADETLRFWNVFGTPEVAKPAPKASHTGMFNSFNHIRWVEQREWSYGYIYRWWIAVLCTQNRLNIPVYIPLMYLTVDKKICRWSRRNSAPGDVGTLLNLVNKCCVFVVIASLWALRTVGILAHGFAPRCNLFLVLFFGGKRQKINIAQHNYLTKDEFWISV